MTDDAAMYDRTPEIEIRADYVITTYGDMIGQTPRPLRLWDYANLSKPSVDIIRHVATERALAQDVTDLGSGDPQRDLVIDGLWHEAVHPKNILKLATSLDQAWLVAQKNLSEHRTFQIAQSVADLMAFTDNFHLRRVITSIAECLAQSGNARGAASCVTTATRGLKRGTP